jgi:flagellar biosynthetic protein FliR
VQFEAAMESFGLLHRQFGPVADSLLLMFFRILAFVGTGPVFNRKNLPMLIKVCIAFFFTGTLFWMVPTVGHGPLSPEGQYNPYVFQVVINIIIGAMLGFTSDMILQTVYAAGNLMNNQIGLSSASLLDPATGRQSMILESLFGYIATLLFIYLGGVEWVILALKRSFELFPIYVVQTTLLKVVSLPYLLTLSGNVLLVGVQLISPVMIITISIDVMLGVVNRTAQQMPVFQLSFALKPAIGIAILWLTLSTLLQTVSNFLNDYSRLF